MTKTVITLETDAGVRSMVGDPLRREGHAVVGARGVEGTERTVVVRRADLLLADPAGRDRTRAMQLFSRFGDRLGGRIRVMLFTAHLLSGERVRALGCADVRARPFEIFEIEERLRAVDQSGADSSARESSAA